jgi:hypothetical protein
MRQSRALLLASSHHHHFHPQIQRRGRFRYGVASHVTVTCLLCYFVTRCMLQPTVSISCPALAVVASSPQRVVLAARSSPHGATSLFNMFSS